jgi:hypothetical protein
MLLLGAHPSPAQEAMEQTRTLCDVADPANACPGDDCRCSEDTIEITFDGDSDSVFEYETFEGETSLVVTVVTDTLAPGVQGFSYGVRHDPALLQVKSVDDLVGECSTAPNDCFWLDSRDRRDVETCGSDAACSPEKRTDGGGWITAVILSFQEAVELPPGRNQIARAEYRLVADAGEAGTLIQVTDRLAGRDAPPMDLNLTVDGRAKIWGTAVDGWIKRVSPPVVVEFLRADVDGSGTLTISDAVQTLQYLVGSAPLRIDCDDAADSNDDGQLNITDAIYTLQFLFQSGPVIPPPFPECGEDPVGDTIECAESNCG